MPDMTHHVALVTGGARGNGAAQCRALVGAGARVLVTDVLDTEGETLAKDLGDRAAYQHLDVTREGDWQAAVAAAGERFGLVTVLVNNAGIPGGGIIEETTLEDWNRVLGVDLTGTFLGMKHVAPSMKSAGSGSIVNISSVQGLRGSAFVYAYVAAKWGVRGMTKSAAIEFAAHNIRVNTVAPGFFDTPMMAGQDATDLEIPMRRAGDPAELAKTVVFLASDDSSYTTGAEIVVDGGLLAGIPLYDSLHGIQMSGPRPE
ncbi:MAG: SDR family NAD(P)-dependent oxidoreductase [Trebonia sp.]